MTGGKINYYEPSCYGQANQESNCDVFDLQKPHLHDEKFKLAIWCKQEKKFKEGIESTIVLAKFWAKFWAAFGAIAFDTNIICADKKTFKYESNKSQEFIFLPLSRREAGMKKKQ